MLLLAVCLVQPLDAENISFPEDAGVINVRTMYGEQGNVKSDDQ
jgi:hypothetical protein